MVFAQMAANSDPELQRPRTLSRANYEGPENRAPNMMSERQQAANQSMISHHHETTLDLPSANQVRNIVTGSTKDLSVQKRPMS